MQVRGINLKQNSRKEIIVGVHEDTFKEFMSSIPKSKKGFFNFKITPNYTTTEAGYTHRAELMPLREPGA